MRVRVGRIGKPFGVAGLLTVEVVTDEPEIRFRPGARLWTQSGEVRVSAVRHNGSRWLLGFAGVADREAAERLRGTELFADVSAGERPAHPDEWYDRDLAGLPCRSPEGVALGTVVSVEHPPAHDLLVVRTPAGHDARVPFVAAIVTQVGADGVVIDAPGGLLDPDLEAGGG